MKTTGKWIECDFDAAVDAGLKECECMGPLGIWEPYDKFKHSPSLATSLFHYRDNESVNATCSISGDGDLRANPTEPEILHGAEGLSCAVLNPNEWEFRPSPEDGWRSFSLAVEMSRYQYRKRVQLPKVTPPLGLEWRVVAGEVVLARDTDGGLVTYTIPSDPALIAIWKTLLAAAKERGEK